MRRALWLVLVLLLVLVPGAIAQVTYEHVATWNTPYPPRGLAVNGTHLFVTDFSSSQVNVLNLADGTLAFQFGGADPPFSRTYGIAVNGSGFIYTTQLIGARVVVNTSSGGPWMSWGDGYFLGPYYIAVNNTHTFVSDFGGETPVGRVVVNTSDGGAGFEIPSDTDYYPRGVAVNAAGNIFVAEEWRGQGPGSSRVHVYDRSGGTLTTWGAGFTRPEGIALKDDYNPQYIYTAANDEGNARIIVNTTTGGPVTEFSSNIFTLGVYGIAVNATGWVFVAHGLYEEGAITVWRPIETPGGGGGGGGDGPGPNDPGISGISPGSGETDRIIKTIITGTNFPIPPQKEGAGTTTIKVWLSQLGESSIIGKEIDILSSKKLACTFNLAGAHPGKWTVNAKRSDGFLTAVLTDAFTVKPATPVPVVQHINPSTVKAGTKAFILTVTGENFAKGNRVRWKGVARETTFVSATTLRAKVLATDIAKAGRYLVSVYRPGRDAATSNGVTFTVRK